MSKMRVVQYLLCFLLVLGLVGGLAVNKAAFAAKQSIEGHLTTLPNQEGQEPEPKLEITAKYPEMEGKSGDSYEFEIDINYAMAKEARIFDLNVIVPENWVTTVRPTYGGGDTDISAVRMQANVNFPEKVKLVAIPLPWALPDPGEYTITLEATSGDIKGSIDLKAIVTARYNFEMYTETGRLNTEAKSGKENHFTIKLTNTGSAAIDDISFSTTGKPQGWSVTYTPEKIDKLEAGLTQDVDVVIEPPPDTIAGDYSMTLRSESNEFNDSLDIRVTVLAPTIWGWVGIIIVVLVIIGLAVLFRQLGRR